MFDELFVLIEGILNLKQTAANGLAHKKKGNADENQNIARTAGCRRLY